MHRLFVFVYTLLLADCAIAQVKNEYLYNPSMPYGVLDIRTNISADQYYYIDEDKTFSYRESAPGVRTNTFSDMTDWDSSPYNQGNLRKKDQGRDEFILNYRILFPGNYDDQYASGYPLLLLFHGAKERGNCYYNDCFHADATYDPNVNSPPAPTSIDHPLLNNDFHLMIGARQHLSARDAAKGRLPNDPSLPNTAFPGFVLMPQMMNIWDSLNVQDVIRLVQLVARKYQIDENRIYVEGLSIGGYAVYEALKRAPWLFAAAIPMSAVSEAANIFRQKQQSKVRHIPIWAFQGGLDRNPTPAQTEDILKQFKAAGGITRYTLYAQAAHVVWGKSFSEPDYYQWLLSKAKNTLHIAYGLTEIDKEKNKFPLLEFAEGFLAYQWEKDGSIITDQKANKITVNAPGVYRARFSRTSATPADGDWSSWSPPVTITQVATSGEEQEDPGDDDPGDGDPDGEDPNGEDPDDGNTDDGEDDAGGEDSGEDNGDDSGDDGENNPDDTDDGEDSGDDNGEDSGEDDGQGDDGEDSGNDDGEDSGSDGNDNSGDDDGTDNNGEDTEDPDDDSNDDDSGGNDSGNDDSETNTPDSTEVITTISPDVTSRVELYPNPVHNNSFNIVLTRHHKSISIRIVDMVGKLLYDQLTDAPGEVLIDPAPPLERGLYTVIVNIDGKVHFKRLIVK